MSKGSLEARPLGDVARQSNDSNELWLAEIWLAQKLKCCICVSSGALKEGSLEAGPLGEVARQLNGSNELWLALALAAPGTSELAPPQLAALACGLVAADVSLACLSLHLLLLFTSSVSDSSFPCSRPLRPAACGHC